MEYINEFVLNMILDLCCTPENNERILKRLNAKVAKDNKVITNKIISLKNSLKQRESMLKSFLSFHDDEFNSDVEHLRMEVNRLNEEISKCESAKATPFTMEDVKMGERYFVRYMSKKDSPLCKKLIRSTVREVLVYEDSIDVALSV